MAEGSRAVVERWAVALGNQRLEVLDDLIHDDFVEEYVQSGERIVGIENLRAVALNYPGADAEPIRGEMRTVLGRDEQYVMGPSFNISRITGTGDEFAISGTMTYPSGALWHLVQFVRVRDGKIWRLSTYFAEPFEPPAWRAPWVEVGDRPT
jgi:SnoaL-like domain